jgi:hypothetical protein
MTAPLAKAQTAPVTGFVEAVTTTAVLGWAWTPGRPEKLSVRLRLGAEIIATAVADMPREDLLRGGIGDGAHAFSLIVPEAVRDRLINLRVFALAEDGTEVALGSSPADDGIAVQMAQIARGVDTLIGSQRLLHRNLQAALLTAPATAPYPEPDPGRAAEIATLRADLAEGIATLELFVTRLEQKLSEPAEASSRPNRLSWTMAGTGVIAMTALVVSIWALVRAMPG